MESESGEPRQRANQQLGVEFPAHLFCKLISRENQSGEFLFLSFFSPHLIEKHVGFFSTAKMKEPLALALVPYSCSPAN